MKIHLVITPAFDTILFNQIFDALVLTPIEIGDVRNVLHFIKGDSFQTMESFRRSSKRLFESSNPFEYSVLQFRTLFNYCNEYRLVHYNNVKDDDIVVFITDINNTKYYFSAVEGKNIFVYTGIWDNLLKGEKKVFAIAYNIMVNVFQSLLGLSWNDQNNSHVIHKENRGCINDFCRLHSSVLLKLRTGFICDDCIEYAIKSVGMSKEKVMQIYEIIGRLREKFSNKDVIRTYFKNDELHISKEGVITIGETKLNLTPIPKAIYIFFASYPEGISSDEFVDIYNQEKDLNGVMKIMSLQYFSLLNKIRKSTNYSLIGDKGFTKNRFSYHISCINKIISNESIYNSQLYLIKQVRYDNNIRVYKLLIDPDMIHNKCVFD